MEKKFGCIFTQPKGTVKDLETNKKHKFRVKAENIYRVGEPLETISSITVKPPYGTVNPCTSSFFSMSFIF
jgi:hypothetical protein